ncbi:MAG: hypothetical protein M3497_05790, partial [Gemmatimonadota bacterium]|nr:hypothetical protein [Gemmatimonadota bacterium]
AKQRIIGLRDVKNLPTNIRYHEDHLAVVQDNFGDLIRYGDGDEVRDVLHPAAGAGPGTYEYRLEDSLSIRVPGSQEPVRVYEVQVRPKDPSRPAMIGSVFVERRMGDIVRMSFTFTSAAYVDRQLDYINVSLDNGLWKGRFWLPNQQRIEIRRQLPELDFPAGGVIRGTMRISGYQFNQPFPPSLFAGAPVVVAPRAAREAFPFERGIHEELREEGGIDPHPDLEAIRRQAAELARARLLSGLPRTRLNIGAASDVFRYNRAEGAVLSAGASFRPAESLRVGVRAGWAFGAGHPLGELEVEQRVGSTLLSASLYGNQPRDVGVGPVASGVINTLAGLTAGQDYTDLFYASGVELGTRDGLTGGRQMWVSGRVEAQRSAQLEVSSSLFGTGFREVRPIDDGTMIGGALGLRREAPTGAARSWGGEVGVSLGFLLPNDNGASRDGGACAEEADCFYNYPFAKPRAEITWTQHWVPRDATLELRGAAGWAFGELPRQELYLLGGRGTLPGYRFRAFGGDRFALAQGVFSQELARPWVRGRLLGSLGATGAGAPGERSLELWGAGPAGLRASVGAGLGIFYDILRVDLARGLGSGGRWELIIETRPSFWNFL